MKPVGYLEIIDGHLRCFSLEKSLLENYWSETCPDPFDALIEEASSLGNCDHNLTSKAVWKIVEDKLFLDDYVVLPPPGGSIIVSIRQEAFPKENQEYPIFASWFSGEINAYEINSRFVNGFPTDFYIDETGTRILVENGLVQKIDWNR